MRTLNGKEVNVKNPVLCLNIILPSCGYSLYNGGAVELKLKVLEIYNTKLDERMERKKFVLERGLLNKKVVEAEKKRTKEEREIHHNMRVFARCS